MPDESCEICGDEAFTECDSVLLCLKCWPAYECADAAGYLDEGTEAEDEEGDAADSGEEVHGEDEAEEEEESDDGDNDSEIEVKEEIEEDE